VETIKLSNLGALEHLIFHYYRFLVNEYSYFLSYAHFHLDDGLFIFQNIDLKISIKIGYSLDQFDIIIQYDNAKWFKMKSIDGPTLILRRGKKEILNKLEENIKSKKIEKNIKFYSGFLETECVDILLGKTVL